MSAEFLADTYALLANYKGAPGYRSYFTDHEIVTTSLNLVEFASTLLRSETVSEGELPSLLAPLYGATVEPARGVILEAAAMKASMVRRGLNCSYVDAWGYCTARSLRIPFLTGDAAFRDVPHVEFVKE